MPKSDLILLALGDPHIQELIERVLVTNSYHVAIAHDRKALNKVLQESSPALVIISEELKDSNGLELAKGLLDRFPTLPILLFTIQDSRSILKKALAAGICDVLYPPLLVESFMDTVENSLKRARRIGDWTRREVKRTTASLEQRIGDLQKLDTIFDHIEDGVVILDERMHILLINPAARRAFGLKPDDPLNGKPILEVVPHPDLRRLLMNGSNIPILHSEITFDDSHVFGAQYTPIPGIGVAITLQDITYLKQIDHLKNEFVGAVSHDLRSPLTAVLGYVELLDRVGPLNDQQKEFVSRVLMSIKNITALVNDLLELGSIESGFDSQKEKVPLAGIISYAVENLRGQVQDRRQTLNVQLPAETLQLRGNLIRLRQMLDNLIGNAIKYTPNGGEISIQTEVKDEQIILRISDTGPGIPPADQQHIFDKFYRASNVPKDVKGSGLGLAIVKSIVDNHQGRIWVESVLGEGSTFTVVLPVYRPEEKKPPS